MKFIKANKEYEYHLYEGKEILGKGYIFESEDCKFYDKPRMNYYIECEIVGNKDHEIVVELVNNLVEVAKSMRMKHKDIDARVYHCCFSNNREMIELYQAIDGFKSDESMHVLKYNIEDISDVFELDQQYVVEMNNLDTNEQINELIMHHSKSFKPGLYIQEDIEELKLKNGFKCISIRKDGVLVANLLIFIREDGVGFLEDMFVNNSERGKGLGKYMVNIVNEYMKGNNVKMVELEVWSNNYKAYNLYMKMGYKFSHESEVSIGMSI